MYIFSFHMKHTVISIMQTLTYDLRLTTYDLRVVWRIVVELNLESSCLRNKMFFFNHHASEYKIETYKILIKLLKNDILIRLFD